MAIEYGEPIKRHEERAVCRKCGNEYIRTVEDQVIGFREKSEDMCPYCGHVNGTSMDYDFYSRSRKLEDDGKE